MFLLLRKGLLKGFLTQVQGQRSDGGHHCAHCEASEMTFEENSNFICFDLEQGIKHE